VTNQKRASRRIERRLCALAIKRQPEGNDPVQLALKENKENHNLCDFSFNQVEKKE
jgi:hypothetical protein